MTAKLAPSREQPCKERSRFVHHDGSCLRCGAVQGEACPQHHGPLEERLDDRDVWP